MDTSSLLPLMLIMGMGGGNRNNMMPLLLLMMMGNGANGSGSTNGLGSIFNAKSLMIGMMPGVGTVGKVLLGGAGAAIAGNMLAKPRARRRTYSYRRPYYSNYRRRRQ